MKIEKFLNKIQKDLLHSPDIHLRTVKRFIQYFECCLSKKEMERWKITIQMISEFTLKQISLDTCVNNSIRENLEVDLHNLKNKSIKYTKKE